MKIIQPILILSVCVLLSAEIAWSQNERISWWGMNGGFVRASDASGAITTAIAQQAVGGSRTGNHQLESGFLVHGIGSYSGFNMNAVWVQLSGGIPTAIHYSLTADGKNIYAGNNSSSAPRLFRSTDNGNTWAAVTGIPSTGLVWALSNLGGTLFAGTWGSGLYRSTNGGTIWTRADSGMSHNDPRGFTRNSSHIFTCTWSGGVYRSTNNGNHWTSASSGITGGGLWPIHALGNYIFVGAQSGGVFRSSDNGTSWQAVNSGLTYPVAYALASVGTDLFVGTGGAGVFRSTNYGNTWAAVNNGMPANLTVYALIAINTILVAGTSNQGVFVSTDRGGSWSAINNGLTNQSVFSLGMNSQYLFAGTSSTVFRREHSPSIVSVRPLWEQPATFILKQNYPNPFNPSTRIPFSVQFPGFTSLKVYDVLGREVATLVNENLQPGTYEVVFDASRHVGMPSGVYFYRLTVGNLTVTKRMGLIK